MKNSIQMQQQFELAILCTGVQVSTPSAAPKVNMKDFKMVASWLGLMLGLIMGAADMGGHVFLRKEDSRSSIQTILSVTTFWSIGVSVMTWVVFALIQYLISLVMNDSEDQLLDTFENRVLLWTVIGVTCWYTMMDAFFLPAEQFLLSLVVMLGSIGIYKILLSCVECLDRRRPKDIDQAAAEGIEVAPLMII